MKNKKTIFIIGILAVIEISVIVFLFISQNNRIKKLENNYNNIVSINTELKTEIENINNKSARNIYEKNKNSIIEISPQTDLEFYGTAVAWDEDEEKIYLITNSHIIRNRKTFMVKIKDSEVLAYVEKDNSDKDIALVYILKEQLSEETLNNIKIINKSKKSVEIGDEIYAIGNNLGDGISITDGILSNKDVNMVINGKNMTLHQTTAAINNGASGGACVDNEGNFVGLITAKVSDLGVDNTGLFIPLENIDSFLNETEKEENNSIFNTTLIIDVDSNMKSNGIESGAFVRKVNNSSRLYEAGLRNNDVIIKINDTEISNLNDLEKISKELNNESNFTITIKRFDYTDNIYKEEVLEVGDK